MTGALCAEGVVSWNVLLMEFSFVRAAEFATFDVNGSVHRKYIPIYRVIQKVDSISYVLKLNKTQRYAQLF
jgi:hypothetical protein